LAIIVPGQLINNIKVLNMPSQESPTQTQSLFSFTPSKQPPQILPHISQKTSIHHHQHRFPIQSQLQQRFSSLQQHPKFSFHQPNYSSQHPKFSSQQPHIFPLQQPPHNQSRFFIQQSRAPRVLFSPQHSRIHHVQQPKLHPIQHHFSSHQFCQFPLLSRNPIIRANSFNQGRKIFKNRTQIEQNNNKIQNFIPRIVEINNNKKTENFVPKTTVQQNIKKSEKIFVPKVEDQNNNKRMETSSNQVLKNNEKVKDGHEKIAEQIDKNTEIISEVFLIFKGFLELV
jgi:hypothetical protein